MTCSRTLSRALTLGALALASCGGTKRTPPPPSPPIAPTEGPKLYALPGTCARPGATYACNPVTNAGCNASAGEACDDDGEGGFGCWPPPNTVGNGGDCDVVDGPSCAAGYVCAGATGNDPGGSCAKYCCSDGDCATHERCIALDASFGTLGYCG